MIKIKKIIKKFNDIYCQIGIHDWKIDTENILIDMKDRNYKFTANRGYRICRNCYKTQHTGLGIFGNKWFNEDDDMVNSRKDKIRRIKLEKIKNNF